MQEKTRFPESFYNKITKTGIILSIIFLIIEAVLFIIDLIEGSDNLFHGLITYFIIPPFFILSILLIPAGALIKAGIIKNWKNRANFLHIDLNKASHRLTALYAIIIGFILFVITLVGAYKGYHLTESVKFCGVLCHSVMHPEYTVYQNSFHARLKCVECHIGEGVDWFVKSKISGSRQVIRTILNNFDRPIKTPVHDLRPAEDTCKHCHWPGKLFGSIDFKRDYFLQDEDNSQWRIRMMMKIGGSDDFKNGIHAHMNLDQDIYYACEDERRQNITWVKTIDKKGNDIIYTSPGSKFKDETPADSEIRKMDCIDCHNRATHHFRAPYKIINTALQYEKLDKTVPRIKSIGMTVLSKKYENTESAVEKIRNSVTTFYKENYADYYSENTEKINNSASHLIYLYTNNTFPEMKTVWNTHPDNIGHLITPGCFRCHDGSHTSDAGQTISRDCNSCHSIIEQGPIKNVKKDIEGIDFKHPVDISEMWKEYNCTECHTGGEG